MTHATEPTKRPPGTWPIAPSVTQDAEAIRRLSDAESWAAAASMSTPKPHALIRSHDDADPGDTSIVERIARDVDWLRSSRQTVDSDIGASGRSIEWIRGYGEAVDMALKIIREAS